MNKKEVRVFDSYSVTSEDKKYYYNLGLNDYNIMEYNNSILKKR